MKTVTISVTEDHIRRGTRDSHCACPIALAIKDSDQIPAGVVLDADLGVCCYFIWWNLATGRTDPKSSLEMPGVAKDFVEAFDDDKAVRPFEFLLNIPELSDFLVMIHEDFRDLWERDCMQYRGVVLTGKCSHWCHDWDGLPVDETTPEWDCCLCFSDADEDAQEPDAGPTR